MSFGGQQSQSFFGPLTGRTATFLLEGRGANLEFACTLVRLIAEAGGSCAVLDLDALYSSNADAIFQALPKASAEASTVIVPEPGADIEGEFARLLGSTQKVVVIDSLNSLYHLISQEDASSRSRKLAFAVAALSYFTKTNGTAAVLTMYRREGFTHYGTARSISTLSEITASVDVEDGELVVRAERGQAWPGGRYSTRTP